NTGGRTTARLRTRRARSRGVPLGECLPEYVGGEGIAEALRQRAQLCGVEPAQLAKGLRSAIAHPPMAVAERGAKAREILAVADAPECSCSGRAHSPVGVAQEATRMRRIMRIG